MLDVCRLCLKDADTDELNLDSISYESRIHWLMPEIDISITPAFTLCSQCSVSLNAAYKFKCECIQNEELVKMYQKQLQTSMITNLRMVKNLLNHCEEFAAEDKVKTECCDQIDVGLPSIISDFLEVKIICDKCRGIFGNKEVFNHHRTDCGANKKFKPVCTNGSKNIKESKNLERSKCEQHNKTFSDDITLQEHLNTYSEKSPLISDLPISLFEKTGENNSSSSSTNLKKYDCNICGKFFKSRSGLHEHKDVHNTDIYECSVCNKSFKTARRLKQHETNKHFGTFICDTCGQKCGSKYILAEHIRTHTGDKPFKCELCGKGFAQRGTLTVHIHCSHTKTKPFVCESCGKSFATKGSLSKHNITHIEYPEKKFACKIEGCDKSFATSHRLYKHARWHELPKNYKCTICDTGFKTGTGLRRHLRCHAGEKPYECSLCHKGFTQNGNLKIHLKSHRPKRKHNL